MPRSPSAKNARAQPSQPAPDRITWPIVAVGASAGGLEAFSDLLTHLPPNTGLSFIFIQHLDPRHESMLTELLQQHTRMKVQQAANDVRPEPDNIYVIPPNTSMEIHESKLRVGSRPESRAQMPIDVFFRSLAKDLGNMSIGVVLSGSASDGTLGLKAIKGEGGITFAQEPSTAAFDGMPLSAIVAGCVDFVLPPAGIAEQLLDIRHHPYVSGPDLAEAAPEAEPDFAEILNLLRTATHVDFSLYKPGTIRRRIFRRMALHKIETPVEYARLLRERGKELDLLFQDLLINVTSFFREPATFEALREYVYPALLKERAGGDPIRIWIPGCSTGEDAYSIAISILEFTAESGAHVPLQIFGTDLSEAALERARAGTYPESISVDVSHDRLRRFFTKVNGKFQIAREIRDMCIFARQNLTKDPPFSRLDLLICRNLLIYLGPVLQKKVMKLFHYALKPSGFLVLGISESVGGSAELFAPLDRSLKIYGRKPVEPGENMDFDSYEEGAHLTLPHRPAVETPHELQKRMDQALLSRYTPPAVLVSRDLRVIHFRGQTGRFLEHAAGAADLNLEQMAHGGLAVEIRNLIQEVDRKKSPLETKTISATVAGAVEEIRISVSPLDRRPGERQFLVVFEEEPGRGAEAKETDERRSRKRKTDDGGRVAKLEEELALTRRYLQTVIEDQEAITEELKSANEEIQSSNEELQSTNEELLTAKEELQSTNEELTTVNEEMQNRNQELVRSNNDLLNLLASVNIPIIMLGSDLRIRRFTPQTERLLNLLSSDVGRPISDFKLKINVPDLEDLVRGVLDNLTAAEREVRDSEGRLYSMWIRPYRTSENKIDGAVLALFDITERKRAAETRYQRLFDSARDGMVIADQRTGQILDVNPFACRQLGQTRSGLIGVPVFAMEAFYNAGIRPQALHDLRENETLRREVRFARREGEWIDVEIAANMYQEGDRRMVQFNIRDIVERRDAAGATGAGERGRDLGKIEAAARLAASISRNFGNDLTAILIYCDLLQRRYPGAEFAPDLERIQAAASRAVELERQLLSFGRRETARKEPVNVNEVLSNMDPLIGAVMDRCTISKQTDPALRAVEANPAQIERIILNLLLNARRAAPEQGSVSIETANVTIDRDFAGKHPAVQAGEYVSISVTDSARPTSPEAATASDPFRADASDFSGLPAAFEAIRDLGAQVWAVSELGVGSTVRVFFRPAPEIAAPEEKPPTRAARDGSETVLIIDPDDEVRVAAARALESRGYKVFHAPSADEALRIVESENHSISLVLAEVALEDGSGPDLVRRIAADRGVKAAYTSSEPDALLARYGIPDNPDLLLRKPYSAEQIAEFVNHMFERNQE